MNKHQKRILGLAGNVALIGFSVVAASVGTVAWYGGRTRVKSTEMKITVANAEDYVMWHILKWDEDRKAGVCYNDVSEFTLPSYDQYIESRNIYSNVIIRAEVATPTGFGVDSQLYVDVSCVADLLFDGKLAGYTSNICQFKATVAEYTVTNDDEPITANFAIDMTDDNSQYITASNFFNNTNSGALSFVSLHNDTAAKDRDKLITVIPRFDSGTNSVASFTVFLECSYSPQLVDFYISQLNDGTNDSLSDQTILLEGDISEIEFRFGQKYDGNYVKAQTVNGKEQFILQKENIDLYNEIIEIYLANRSISQYFREMIILYTSYPMDKRETILFQNLTEKINKAISGNRKAILYLTDGSKKTVDFYGISGTNEQIFNYVIGIEKNENRRSTFSYRLNKVKTIVIIPDAQIEISEEEKEKLELMVYQGPIFAMDEIYDVAVEFNEYGLQLFRLWIHDRPKPYKVEGNVYHFKSSLNHLAIYFYKFGTTAKILSPEPVRKFMKDRFLEAANQY